MKDMILEEIEQVMNEKVRPHLALHSGNVEITEYKEGILYVRMLGECSGCPSADLTVESLVDRELTAAIPQISKVVMVTGVSDALMAEARALLKARHSNTNENIKTIGEGVINGLEKGLC